MPPEEARTKSRAIALKFMQLVDWQKVKNLNIYSSRPGWNEVDTKLIRAAVHAQWPNIKIVTMSSDKTSLPPVGQFDVIIVPTLGFDGRLFRLGLGAGFYDRFLATHPYAQKIGLAYEHGFVEGDLPKESHDIPLNIIVTESKIYRVQ
jgi:5-formyltetrahydrofolate cyclo-ligase